MKNVVARSLAILSTSGAVLATPVAYEGFDYAAGSALTGQNGGSFWSGAWTISGAGTVIGTPGLSYTDGLGNPLAVIGNTDLFSATANAGNFRVPATSPDAVGSSLYISFIARMNVATAASYAGFSLFNGTTETLFLGDASTPTTWSIDPKGGTVASGTTPVTTQTFLVYRVDFLATSATIRLFENPVLGVEPALGAATATATRTTALLWDNVRIQSNHAGAIDEVRIGTTYADVAPVPEPAALGVLAIGGVALAARRRQR